MYVYKITSSPANKNSNIDYSESTNLSIINKSIADINSGVAFTRTNKEMKLLNVKEKELVIELSSKTPLSSPGKVYAGFSKMLIKNSNVFRDSCIHKKLFINKIVSMRTSIDATNNLFFNDLDASKILLEIIYDQDAKTQGIRLEAKEEIFEILKTYQYQRDLLDAEQDFETTDIFPNDKDGYEESEETERRI